MSRNNKFHNPEGLYFVNFAVVDWLDVITHHTKGFVREHRNYHNNFKLLNDGSSGFIFQTKVVDNAENMKISMGVGVQGSKKIGSLSMSADIGAFLNMEGEKPKN